MTYVRAWFLYIYKQIFSAVLSVIYTYSSSFIISHCFFIYKKQQLFFKQYFFLLTYLSSKVYPIFSGTQRLFTKLNYGYSDLSVRPITEQDGHWCLQFGQSETNYSVKQTWINWVREGGWRGIIYLIMHWIPVCTTPV